jgi:hypothetical protein
MRLTSLEIIGRAEPPPNGRGRGEKGQLTSLAGAVVGEAG